MAGRFTIEAVFKGVDNLTKPVSRMQNRVQKFTRGMIKGLKKVTRVAAAVGRALRKGFTRGFKVAGVAVAAATVAIVKFTKEADSLAKQSRLLDFDIEQLQLWKFAAGQAGMTTQEFDKSLLSFTKRVGEARHGTGAMFTLLQKSNPTLLKQIQSTKDSGKAFELLIDALGKTKNAQDAIALANAAGGKSAAKFILLAKLERSEREKLFKEMRQNGLITKAQAKLAEDLTDSWTSMMLALNGLRNQVLEPLMPLLIEGSKHIRQWAIDNKALISGKFKDFLKFVVNNFSDIVAEAKFFIKVAAWILGIVVALKVLIGVLTVVNLLMAANPAVLIILAIIAAISLLVFAIKFLIDNWKAVGDMFKRVGNIMSIAIRTPFHIITGLLGILFDKFVDFGMWLKDSFPKAFAVLEAVLIPITATIAGAVRLTKDLFEMTKRVLGLSSAEDEEKAALTRAQALNPSANILANLTDEERAGMDDQTRAVFGLPPKSESSASAVVTIRDETGRAEIQSQTSGNGSGINLQPSGAF